MTVLVRFGRALEIGDGLVPMKRWGEPEDLTGAVVLLASAVAEFGMLLRESDYRGKASYAAVLARAREYAYGSKALSTRTRRNASSVCSFSARAARLSTTLAKGW